MISCLKSASGYCWHGVRRPVEIVKQDMTKNCIFTFPSFPFTSYIKKRIFKSPQVNEENPPEGKDKGYRIF